MNVLYKATATSTGGRDGRAVSSDQVLDVTEGPGLVGELLRLRLASGPDPAVTHGHGRTFAGDFPELR